MTTQPDPPNSRQLPAPALREVAVTWWERHVDPVVAWNAGGTSFDLVDPDEPEHRLTLLRLAAPAEDPDSVAEALAEGLAACDFPPTGDRAAPNRVRATLRAARLTVTEAPDSSTDRDGG